MDFKRIFAFIFFQCVTNIPAFAAEGNSMSSRSAYFVTQENKRLKDHVVKRFKSPSLLSCSQSCLLRPWCTSTNFKAISKNGKGICELNKLDSVIDTRNKLGHEEGVIFSMFLKVIKKDRKKLICVFSPQDYENTRECLENKKSC